MRGTIDGIEVYLSEDQLPAFTLSVNSILDPSKVQGTGSTTMRVIATKEARRVLGGERMGEMPRSGRPLLRIGEDSVDLFRANVVPVRHNRNEIECIGIGGNASWFEYAKRTRLPDVEWPTGLAGTLSNILNSWNSLDYLYWPLVDYGDFEGEDDSYEVNVDSFRPGVRLFLVLQHAMQAGGFTLVAKGKRAPREINKLIHLEDGSAIRTRNPITSLGIFDPPDLQYQYEADGDVPVPIMFDDLTGSPAGWAGYPDYKYTTQEDGVMFVSFTAILPYSSDSSFDDKRFRVVLYDETDGVVLSYMDSPQIVGGGGAVSFGGDLAPVYVPEGHVVYLGVTINSAVPSVTFTNNAMDAVFDVNGAFTLQRAVDISSAVPQEPLSKALIDLCVARCYVLNTVGTTVEVWAYEDYFKTTSPNSRDWRDRMDHSVAPAKMVDDVPSVLGLEWTPDAEDWNINRLTIIAGGKYGNASERMEEGYGSPATTRVMWSQSFMSGRFGGCIIPVIKPKEFEEVTFEHKARLLYADGMATGSWHFGVSRSSYPRCYFVRPSGEEHVPVIFDNPVIMGAQQPTLVDQEWGYRLQGMRSRILEAYLFIRDHELRDFDFGMPTLVDDGGGPAWYWVQEILDHRFGKGVPTKCRLVKIPGKEVSVEQGAVVEPTYPDQPVPFVCAGEGTIALSLDGTEGGGGENLGLLHIDAGGYSAASGGYFTATWPGGGSATAANADTYLPIPAATACLFSSDSGGTRDGFITAIRIGGVSAIQFNGYDGQHFSYLRVEGSFPSIALPTTSCDSVHLKSPNATEYDLTSLSGLYDIAIEAGPAQEITITASANLTAIIANNCALSATTVDHLINQAYASVLLGASLSAGVDLASGTSAAPTAASATALHELTVTHGITVLTN